MYLYTISNSRDDQGPVETCVSRIEQKIHKSCEEVTISYLSATRFGILYPTS